MQGALTYLGDLQETALPKNASARQVGEQSTTSATPVDDKIAAITLATDPFKASLSGPFARHEVPSDCCESAGASFFVCRFDVICIDTGIFEILEFRRVLAIMLSCKTNKKATDRG